MAETIFYNNKNIVGIGNVGIGTTNPSRPFEVQSGDVSIGGGTINTISGVGLGPKLMIASDVALLDVYAGDARSQLMLTGSSNTNKRLALMYDTSNNFGLIQSMEYSIGAKPLILNLAGGNIGIGTSNPGGYLSFPNGVVNKCIALYDNAPTDTQSTAVNFLGFGINAATLRYQVPYNNQHQFYNASNVAMTIVGTNVGIGITQPTAPLTVSISATNNDPYGSQIFAKNPTNGAGQYSIIGNAIGGSSAAAAYYALDVSGNYGFSFGMAGNSSRLQFHNAYNFGGTEVLTILTSGNVGIGTTNPSTNLHIYNSSASVIRVEAPSASGIDPQYQLYASGGQVSKWAYSWGNSYTYFQNNSTQDSMRFYNGTSGAVVLQPVGGDVGIGTTNPINWFGQACKLSVFGTSSDASTFHVDSGSISGGDTITMTKRYSSNFIIRMDSTPNVYNALFIYFATNGGSSNPGTIQATNATTMVYGSTSDYRIKSNVVPLSNSLEFIDKLRPVNFTFNEAPTEIVAGFIAHELQEFIPHAVTGVKDDVDENGKIRTQNVDVSFVVPYLTAALKDLVSQLQTAQNDIALLESRLAAIEARLAA